VKRYKITAGIDIDRLGSHLTLPVVRVNENKDGEWVKWEDVKATLTDLADADDGYYRECGERIDEILEES